MFGESESESPQVPSPWDSLISLSSSPVPAPSPRTPPVIPKLVPEAEEGNVEYKLQLLSPSPGRFARLVTQLKWRLLEGGGQAYYELGVADSGALIGLPRAELEQTLETLEMMAGEIGASVIVVKEIEVPAAISGLAAEDTDKWNRKRQWKKAKMAGEAVSLDYDDDGGTTTEGTTTGTSTTESESEWVIEDANPAIFSFEDDLPPTSALDKNGPSAFLLDLEISSVFKPRPFRTRLSSGGEHAAQSVLFDDEQVEMKDKRKLRKHNTKQFMEMMSPACEPASPEDRLVLPPPGHGRKRATRRMARDRRRAEKRNALVTYADNSLSGSGSPLPSEGYAGIPPVAPSDTQHPISGKNHTIPETTEELVAGLQSLHVTVAPNGSHVDMDPSCQQVSPATEEGVVDDADGDNDVFASPTPFSSALSNSIITLKGDSNNHTEHLVSALGTHDNAAAPSANQSQPRMIVEALVVRKMSMEEAFLDFEGFQLI